MEPWRPKMAPRWSNEAPRRPQDNPKMAEDIPDGSRWFCITHHDGPRRPKMAPRWPMMAPRQPQDGPRKDQDGPKMVPRQPQNAGPKAPSSRCACQSATGGGGVPISYACYIGRTPPLTTYNKKQPEITPPETPLIPNASSQHKETIRINAEAGEYDFGHLVKSSRKW